MRQYITGIFIVTALLLAGCNSTRKNNGQALPERGHTEDDGHDHGKEGGGDAHADEIVFTKAQAEMAGLEIYTVEPGIFHNVIKTSGQIEAAQGDEATIVATSNGIVSFPGRRIAPGTPVKAGEAIVTISARNLSDGDPAAKVKIAYETALKEYKRAEGLAKDRIISAKEFDQIRLRYETARTAYEAQASNITAAGIRVASPINGYITSLSVKQGDYVSVGQPIATVSQNRRLQLRAEVAEGYFNELKAIRDANFITPYNNRVYKLSELNGRLLSAGKASDKTSFYIPVTFEFDNIGEVIPGSFVEVFLLSSPQDNTISVPVTALTEEQGVYYVYVQIEDEAFQKREVKPGESNGSNVRILSGLSGGEKVVSKGAYQVKLAGTSAVIPEGHSH